jgi:hypothetical protein
MRPALLIVAVLAIVACGSAQTSPSSTVVPSPVESCALTTEPGPADEPDRSGGDLIDMTDFGGGRWRLCLTEPTAATVEHTAWCIWTADRTAVSEVNGLSAKIGAVDYDAGVSLPRNEFFFGTTDQDGLVATYEPGAVPAGDGSEDGRAGYLAFDVRLKIDPEAGAPPGAQPRFVGSMRWLCGDPPPAR